MRPGRLIAVVGPSGVARTASCAGSARRSRPAPRPAHHHPRARPRRRGLRRRFFPRPSNGRQGPGVLPAVDLARAQLRDSGRRAWTTPGRAATASPIFSRGALLEASAVFPALEVLNITASPEISRPASRRPRPRERRRDRRAAGAGRPAPARRGSTPSTSATTARSRRASRRRSPPFSR